MNESVSLAANYFDAKYAENSDPWKFATSAYEHAKYDDTLAALSRTRYARALEIGCSIGVLTERLATYCDELLSVDVAEAALAQARVRCAPHSHVRFANIAIPNAFPDGRFDLFVISEVGYYWSHADLVRVQALIVQHAAAHTQCLLVHWTPFVESYPLTGDAVHAAFLADVRFQHRHGHVAESYRLDLFEL